MPGRPADLIEIPGSLWQRAAMTEALRGRDIGRVFQLISQYAGISQTRLAIACGMSQPKISGIMRGTTRVEALEVFQRIADGLDMPDAARITLGLAPGGGRAGPRREPDSLSQVADRSRTPELSYAGPVPAGPGQPAPDADASAMRAFRSADLRVGGGHVYPGVLSYLRADVAPRLLGGEDGGSAGVFTAAAALTEMAGWMAHDAGRDTAAGRHFERSLALAGVGGDQQLRAHVLGSMSHLASHLSQPDTGVALAREGRSVLRPGPSSPDLEARLLALEARGRAARREPGACAALLAQAERALDQRPAAERSPWTGTFDAGSLAGEASRCMTVLGDWAGARRQARQVVRLRAPSRVRSRAFAQLTLAAALVAEGQPDEACAIAADVIDATQSLGSYLVTGRLLGLRRSLRRYDASPAVASFLAQLDGWLHERRWLHPGSGAAAVPEPDQAGP